MTPATSHLPAHEFGAQTAPRRVVARLFAATLVAIALAAGATALLILAIHRSHWWSAWAAALAVGLPAAVLSLIPVAAGFSAGLQTAAYGYLAGAVIRVLLITAGLLVAVIGAKIALVPIVILVAPLYLAQLVTEVAVLGWTIWPKRQTSLDRACP